MRQGLFVYCRQTLAMEATDDAGTTTGTIGEAQQAPDDGADADGSSDVCGGHCGGTELMDEPMGRFHMVTARHISVTNDAGQVVVALSANDDGHGLVWTHSAKGKRLLELTTTYKGGLIYVHNKTGEEIVELRADDYGNGYIGAWNRKGKGRTLQPGP